jgi:hypothetical protein
MRQFGLSCSLKMTDYRLLYGYIGLALGFGVTALLIITFTKGRLGYQHYRSERQGASPED